MKGEQGEGNGRVFKKGGELERRGKIKGGGGRNGQAGQAGE